MAQKSKSRRKPLTAKKRTALIAGMAILGILGILMISGSAYVWYLLERVQIDDPSSEWSVISWESWDESTDDPSPGEITYTPAEIPDIAASLEEIPVMYNTDYVTNILLIGVESKGSADPYKGRSDSTILVSINRATRTITLVSLMRDNYVSIPGYGYSKLNAAYSWGGPALLKETIERNFRMKIDQHVAVNFAAFEKVIDAMGGLEVEMSAAEAAGTGVGDQDGIYTLSGEQALMYARIRYGVGDDFGRTGRQRKVIKLLTEKAKTMSVGQIAGVLDSVLGHVSTNISEDELLGYVFSSSEYLGYTIQDYQMPPSNGYDDPYIEGVGRVLRMTDAKGSVLAMLHKLYATE